MYIGTPPLWHHLPCLHQIQKPRGRYLTKEDIFAFHVAILSALYIDHTLYFTCLCGASTTLSTTYKYLKWQPSTSFASKSPARAPSPCCGFALWQLLCLLLRVIMVFRLTAAQIITAKAKQEEIGRLSGHPDKYLICCKLCVLGTLWIVFVPRC